MSVARYQPAILLAKDQGQADRTFAHAVHGALRSAWRFGVKQIVDPRGRRYIYKLLTGERNPRLSDLEAFVSQMPGWRRRIFAAELHRQLTTESGRWGIEEFGRMFGGRA